MDIKILDSWLREYLETKANPDKIAEILSLSGPSVEKVEKIKEDALYHIEVTTNRVDSMSVLGIAREAAVILAQSKIKASFKSPKKTKTKKTNKTTASLNIKVNKNLVKRVMAVVLEVQNKKTPSWIKERLEASGMRSLNLAVDITNYVMLEIGHPTHVFDYDLIQDKSLVFRESDPQEKITTFDNKQYSLPGSDIVIDDGEGRIIDLPGIIGTKNSVVNENTKRIVFFIDNNDPDKIRKTSTRLGIRTVAAILNEKGVDPELAQEAFEKGLSLYLKLMQAKMISPIYDIYPTPYKPKKIKVRHEFIKKILGIEINSLKIIQILKSLGFETTFDQKKSVYLIKVPSWRALDISIPEDIVEEVARLYGYHTLPSHLMTGALPENPPATPFEFERKIKETLKGLGGIEIYTLSLVAKPENNLKPLALKNPLGESFKYLRTSLLSSLKQAVSDNSQEKEPFHLFEIANVYLPKKNDLPYEVMTLAGIFSQTNYQTAKGVVESLLEELHLQTKIKIEDKQPFLPSHRTILLSNSEAIGEFGELEKGLIYYEFKVEALRKNYKSIAKFIPLPKYPAQVEDITFTLPAKTKIGEVEETLGDARLKDIFGNNYTFTIKFQDPKKTLTNKEVQEKREKLIKIIAEKFGGLVKN